MLFESKTKKMNKLRVSIIPFNWKIQQEWAFLVWTPGTLERTIFAFESWIFSRTESVLI